MFRKDLEAWAKSTAETIRISNKRYEDLDKRRVEEIEYLEENKIKLEEIKEAYLLLYGEILVVK